jgi:hypothetical protein
MHGSNVLRRRSLFKKGIVSYLMQTGLEKNTEVP